MHACIQTQLDPSQLDFPKQSNFEALLAEFIGVQGHDRPLEQYHGGPAAGDHPELASVYQGRLLNLSNRNVSEHVMEHKPWTCSVSSGSSTQQFLIVIKIRI